MSDETRRVLDLLAQGKITVDEADRLLAAMGPVSNSSATTGATAAGKGAATGEASPPRYLRITVTRTGNWSGDDGEQARRARMWPGHMGGRSREVTVRVPVALVRNGMRLGAMIPGLSGAGLQARLRERGVDVDLSKIDTNTIDQLVGEFGEMNIDIDSGCGGKAQVHITSE
jgi:SHOCT-like protein